METAEEKLAWLGAEAMSTLKFEEARPDGRGTWIKQSLNDFDALMPFVSKSAKSAASSGTSSSVVAKLYSLGASTNRDEWLLAEDSSALRSRVRHLIHHYESRLGVETVDDRIKWSETLLRRSKARMTEAFLEDRVVSSLYRPFVTLAYYQSTLFVDRPGLSSRLFPTAQGNSAICFMTGDRQPFSTIAAGSVPNLNMFSADAAQYVTFWGYAADGTRIDNITDWCLAEFQKSYQPSRGKQPQPITKQAIFHYVYAVLHDPQYRTKYAQNLKREFPRIPLYGDIEADFWQWAGWGEALMALHIGYENVTPFALVRTDVADKKVRASGQSPKVILKADPGAGRIVIDSETTLTGIPPAAWDYKLGNRCALDWVLDQHKEKKPKDPTIRAKFDTYRFADHKARVIDLLARVVTVSVKTVAITEAMVARLR
jgi:predicted helicase